MALQDFTTYTEVDPNSRYTATSTKIDVAGLDRSEDAYVYKDYGVNFFAGDFTHKITAYIGSASQNGGFLRMAWGLANALNDVSGLRGAAENYLECYITKNDASNRTINIAEYYGSNGVDTSINLSLDTPYYLTIVRDEAVGTYGTLYCYIYSDSARTTLVDTLTITLRAKVDFRYLYGANSFNNSTSGLAFTGYVENLYDDLQVYSYDGAGGGITGGSATIIQSMLSVGSGGGIAGGSVSYIRAMFYDSSGGGIVGGNADYSFNGAGSYTMDGGSIVGGSADIIRSALFVSTGGAVAGGTAPYSFTITSNIQEIMWELYDQSTGDPITGASGSTLIKFRRTPDGYIYDWADDTFKASGWTSITSTLSEKDATNLAGLYVKEIDVALLTDGRYQIFVTYTASTPKQRGSIEFLIKDGAVWDVHTSDNVDVASSTRLAAAGYTAPDNAGIAALPTLAEMLAGGVAKESTLATAQADITSVLNYAIAMSKWKNNRLARTVAGTTETWVLYDDDSTTPMLTWTNNISTRVRTKAT